jgi:predicted aconitase with swiveling domain
MKTTDVGNSAWFRRSIPVAAIASFLCFAPGANANLLFKAEAAPVTYTGAEIATAPLVFSTKAGTAECTTMTVSGSNKSASSSTAEVAPAFGAGTCKNFGMASRSIITNGCEFKFTLGAVSATLDIVCKGKGIELEATGCTVTVSPQVGLQQVIFFNQTGANRDLLAQFKVKNISYVIPAGCPLTTPGSYTDGSLNGEVTIEASNRGSGANSGRCRRRIWNFSYSPVPSADAPSAEASTSSP